MKRGTTAAAAPGTRRDTPPTPSAEAAPADLCYPLGMRPTLAFASALLLLVGSGCGSQGHGDLDHLDANPKSFGTPIAQGNDPAHRLPSGATMRAKGVVVVAVDTYDETQDGKSIGNVYVEDPVQPTPWSGMTLYQVTLNPPDLALNPGQGVDLVGPYQPFAGPASSPFSNGIMLPEVVKGSLTLSYEGESPKPVDITMADVADPVKAMKYVGMLVRLQNVTVGAYATGKRQQAPINGNSNFVLAGQFMPIQPDYGGTVAANTTLKSVTGLMNYFYSHALCPRSSADIEK
jgi:hypothetical protein